MAPREEMKRKQLLPIVALFFVITVLLVPLLLVIGLGWLPALVITLPIAIASCLGRATRAKEARSRTGSDGR